MGITVLSSLFFIFLLIVFLPLDQMFPGKKLHKLIIALDTISEEQIIKGSWQEKLFYFAERTYRVLNLKTKPEKYEIYNEKLIIAGISEQISVEALIGMKILAAIMILILYSFILICLGFSTNLFILTMLMPFVGYWVPDSIVNGKIKKRQWNLQVELPNVLNTLAIITDAGLGLSEAIKKICEIRKGELINELKKVLDEMNMGIIQRDAFLRMAERCKVNEISTFVFTLIQSLEKGSAGVTIALKEQSKEVWEKRKNRARELGEKASMRLFLPMMLLSFPALLVFLIGPAVISIFQLLGD